SSYNAFLEGNPVKAMRFANRMVEQTPTARAYLLQAYMLRALGEPAEALLVQQVCLKLADTERSGTGLLIDAWTSKAAIHLDLGDTKAAEVANRKAYGLAIRQLSEIRDGNGVLDQQANHYQFACVHATFAAIEDVEGNKFDARIDRNLAMKALQKAVDIGYRNHAHMSKDLDLEALHGDSRFEALLKRIK
ncbi:hypothetical protein OAU50_08615, partial [Planctomycetota bacterium]|nr:hypothetical protein [Planctomycetota bacterium]